MGEREVKIALIPKEWIGEEEDMYRVSCDDMHCGWGTTLLDAIRDYDEKNSN